MNPALFNAGLEALGVSNIVHSEKTTSFYYNGSWYNTENNQLVSSNANAGEVADLVRRHYSNQVVKYAAARNGWSVQQTGQFAYNIVR